MIRSLLLAALLVSATPAAFAQTVSAPLAATPFVTAEARAVISKLASTLADNYVYPSTGREFAEKLHAKLVAGDYDGFADARSFASAVTTDLRAVSPDRHLRLLPPGSAGPRLPSGAPVKPIAASGWIAPSVAYIEFQHFSGEPDVLETLRRFLIAHLTANSLIIDAREHHGGGLAEMDILFSYLFDRKTPLLTLETRVAADASGGNPFEGYASIAADKGSADVVRRVHSALPNAKASGLSVAKVIVLTSGRTASAAEHMALALKRTHRATVVGETTAGAGHYGSYVDMGYGYRAFVPVGRTFDPDTGKDWEAVGVTPDVQTSSEHALDTALTLLGVAKIGEQALRELQ